MSNRDLFKGTTIYTISKVFTKAGSILLLPILTRLLTPEEYGIIGLINPIIGFIPLFLVFGLYISQMRDYVKFKNNKKELGKYIFSLNIFLWGINIIFFFLLITPVGKQLISHIIDYRKIPFYPYVFITLIIGFINIFNLMARNYFQTVYDFKRVGISSVVSFGLSSLVSLILIYYFDFGPLGRIIGKLVGSVFIFIVLYLSYFKEFNLQFNKKYLNDGLEVGFPMMFSALLGNIVNYSDRIVLAKFLPLDIVGVYSLAYTGGLVLNLVINSFNDTWKPMFFDIIDKDNNDKRISHTIIYFIFILSAISLLGQLFGREIIYIILPKSFNETTKFFPYILPGVMLIGFNQYLSNFLVYYKDTKFSPIITVLSGILNLGINIIFIPKYGAMVAVWSTIISFCIITILYFIFIYNRYKIKFNYLKLILLVILNLNPLLFYLINMDINLFSFFIKFIYLSTYIVLVHIFIIDMRKISSLYELVIGKRNK